MGIPIWQKQASVSSERVPDRDKTPPLVWYVLGNKISKIAIFHAFDNIIKAIDIG